MSEKVERIKSDLLLLDNEQLADFIQAVIDNAKTNK